MEKKKREAELYRARGASGAGERIVLLVCLGRATRTRPKTSATNGETNMTRRSHELYRTVPSDLSGHLRLRVLGYPYECRSNAKQLLFDAIPRAPSTPVLLRRPGPS